MNNYNRRMVAAIRAATCGAGPAAVRGAVEATRKSEKHARRAERARLAKEMWDRGVAGYQK